MFKNKATLFLLFALLCSSVFGQTTITAVSETVMYRADSVEQLLANGKAYLKFPAEPVKISAVLIEIKNNSVGYIEITKVGSFELPDVVDAYVIDAETKVSRYIYEHKGKGTYHVRSTSETGRPVYEKFEVKGLPTDPPPTDPPPTDPPPTDPPPTDPPSDHKALVEMVRKALPPDPVTAAILSKAYLSVIDKLTPDFVTREMVPAIVEQARRDALNSAPPVHAQWNVFLRYIGTYFDGVQTKEQYIEALRVLAAELTRGKPTNSQVDEQPPKPVSATVCYQENVPYSTRYVPQWTYPGDLDIHLMGPPHNVPEWELSVMTYEEKLRRHDDDHNRGLLNGKNRVRYRIWYSRPRLLRR